MVLRISNSTSIMEELQEVRNRIEELRKVPVSSRDQHIQIINEINSLLKKNNELLIIRQKSLKNRNEAIGEKINNLVARFL